MRKSHFVLAGLVALALAFRLFLLNYRFAVSFDEPHYLQMAASLVQGHIDGLLHPYWSPGYPLVAAFFAMMLDNYELAGRLANIVLGSLTIVPVYLLAKRVFETRTALWAAGFLALYPPLAYLHTSALAEPAYMFFGFWAVWLGWRALVQRRWMPALLAGMCVGMAYLTKPEGIGFMLVYFAVLGLILIRRMLRGRPVARFRFSLMMPVGFLLVAGWYLLYLHGEAGYWTLSAKGAANQQFEATYFTPEDDDVFEILNPERTALPMDEIYHTGTFLKNTRTSGPKVRVSPGLLLKKYVTNFFRVLKYGVPVLMTFPLLILFGLGLFSRSWGRRTAGISLYLLSFIAFYWFVLVPMFHINERYLLSMMPLAAIWIAAGFLVQSEWFSETILHLFDSAIAAAARYGVVLALAFVVGLSLLPEFGKVMQNSAAGREEWDEPVELKLAGTWLRENTIQNPPIIVSYNKAVDFYAGNYDLRSGVSWSKDSLDVFWDYARYRGAGYFAASERYLQKFPNLAPLFSGEGPEALKLLHEVTGPSGYRARIFTWKD